MLTDFQKRKLIRLFNFYDSNGNEYIEHKDIFEICANFTREYNWQPGSDQDFDFRELFLDVWKKLICLADTNLDNKISLSEFIESYEVTLGSEENYLEFVLPFFENLFPIISTDKENISLSDFKKLYGCFQNDEAIAEDAFKIMDLNGDGSISKEEGFILYRQFYFSQDEGEPGNSFFGI